MMLIRFVAIVLFLMVSLPSVAGPIAIDIDEDVIAVSLGFSGQDITVFGVDTANEIDNIVITGPEKTAQVRKKSSILGAWINTDRVVFQNAPSYYSYTKRDVLNTYLQSSEKNKAKPFKDALIRNMLVKNLYDTIGQSVIYYYPTGLFSVHVQLPAGVPVGQYNVSAFDVKNTLIAQTQFRVKQTGTNAKIRTIAHHYSLLYALGCILIAVGAGWIANRLRKAR